MQKIHVGDIGTQFDYEIRDEDGELIDLETVEELFVRLKKPDGTTVDFDLTAGADSIASVTFDDDFDLHGYWQHQYRVNMPGGTGWWSEKAWFRVHKYILENVEAS